MNNTPTPRADAVDAQEWQLQQTAWAQERRADAAGGGAGLQQYRLLDRVLRQVPAPELPADFATALARRVERERLLDGRWERRLLGLMLLLFGVLVAVVLVWQGGEWLAGWQQALPSLPRWGSGWLLLLVLVLAWNQLPDLLRLWPARTQNATE